MNWLNYLLRALQVAPLVVAGIEQLHSEAPGVTKKQMAMDALGLASYTASVVAPEQQDAIKAATQLTSNAIDNTVQLFNALGLFQHKPEVVK